VPRGQCDGPLWPYSRLSRPEKEGNQSNNYHYRSLTPKLVPSYTEILFRFRSYAPVARSWDFSIDLILAVSQ
jgi:hypothetical protein